MPNPTPYDRSFSFTQYQALHPSDPLPGDEVDAELNSVQAAITETQSALEDIRRSDGVLNNQIVTPDSLAPTALALITGVGVPRGNWITATSYAAKDLVAVADATYIAVTPHTSGTFAVDLAAGKWMLFNLPVASIIASVTAGIPGRNLIVNGDFRINQRGYSTGATLAAGVYGHDRWKAGASGGDYLYSQNAADTGITISASKTVLQIVEDKNVAGGTYTLSWNGTAQARIGINGAAPSGAFAVSPITAVGATGNQTISVEFNPGTLADVQLEAGTVGTPFERVNYADMLVRCQRYFQSLGGNLSTEVIGNGFASTTTTAVIAQVLKVSMRTAPTFTTAGTFIVSDGGSNTSVALSAANIATNSFQIVGTGTGLTQFRPYQLQANNDLTARVQLSAEL